MGYALIEVNVGLRGLSGRLFFYRLWALSIPPCLRVYENKKERINFPFKASSIAAPVNLNFLSTEPVVPAKRRHAKNCVFLLNLPIRK